MYSLIFPVPDNPMALPETERERIARVCADVADAEALREAQDIAGWAASVIRGERMVRDSIEACRARGADVSEAADCVIEAYEATFGALEWRTRELLLTLVRSDVTTFLLTEAELGLRMA